MGAHLLDAEASVPPTNSGDAVENFAEFLDANPIDEDDEQEAPEGDEDPDAPEGDEPEQAQEDEDEPDAPAIDPPVSWGTDAKELFAQLPLDLQAQVVEREAQREKFVQAKSNEVVEAKRSARIEAETAFADESRRYAQEVEYFAAQFSPQAPDPALANHDPVAFIQQNARYQAALQNQQNLLQRANQARAEAEQRDQSVANQQIEAEAAFLAQQIPEWTDDAKRMALLTEVQNLGAELGYSNESMTQMSAQDILALRKAVAWKADAAKWSAQQKTKMQKVRDAKTLPRVVRPGVAPTRGEASSARAQHAWQNVTGARSKEAQANAFADYLETSGQG